MSRPIVIVAGTAETEVYVQGEVELYLVDTEACQRMFTNQLAGIQSEEETFARTPGTIREFVGFLATTVFMRTLNPVRQLVRRLGERDE